MRVLTILAGVLILASNAKGDGISDWIKDLKSSNPAKRRAAALSLKNQSDGSPAVIGALVRAAKNAPVISPYEDQGSEKSLNLDVEAAQESFLALVKLAPNDPRVFDFSLQWSCNRKRYSRELWEAASDNQTSLHPPDEHIAKYLTSKNPAKQLEAAILLAENSEYTGRVLFAADLQIKRFSKAREGQWFKILTLLKRMGVQGKPFATELRNQVKSIAEQMERQGQSPGFIEAQLQKVNRAADTLLAIDPGASSNKEVFQRIFRIARQNNFTTQAQNMMDHLNRNDGKPTLSPAEKDRISLLERLSQAFSAQQIEIIKAQVLPQLEGLPAEEAAEKARFLFDGAPLALKGNFLITVEEVGSNSLKSALKGIDWCEGSFGDL